MSKYPRDLLCVTTTKALVEVAQTFGPVVVLHIELLGGLLLRELVELPMKHA